MTELVIPGDRLCREDEYQPGTGTYCKQGVVYASVVGVKVCKEQATSDGKSQPVHVVEVEAASNRSLVPAPGDIVTVKVSRVQPTTVSCTIMCVGQHALSAEFRGLIRQQDVRATEIDKVVMYDCFRPGDIVRAQVLSLGDARSFYLTTAQDHLGVVYAKSVAGHEMVPTDWTSMTCSVTGAVEKRKVASTAAGLKTEGQ